MQYIMSTYSQSFFHNAISLCDTLTVNVFQLPSNKFKVQLSFS